MGKADAVLHERDSLKAEVERLKENIDKLCKHGDLEIERLKAEVERLRKAGDELLENYKTHRVIFPSAVYAWHDAKEGKQS